MPEPSGFLLVDKPAGCSSFDVIRQLRRITGIRKIGHTGTLDPFATGLLICALGSSTRLCKYLEAEDKTYSATLRLGIQTSTGDTEGEVIHTSANIPAEVDPEFLRAQVSQLLELRPPRHSALKVNGRPAYAYARRGEALELDPRPVRISEFSVLDFSPPDLSYRCRVSKGTYIRSLSEYIAQCLNCAGHTVALRREAIGGTGVGEARSLEALNAENFRAAFYPARKLMPGFEFLTPSAAELEQLRNGQSVSAPGQDTLRILLLDEAEAVLGVARRKDGIMYPVINLN
ncbi:MAG: tRNA pseudouridine(55) synthase TruB [Candidatus Cloacimonetes bacterium]|nr:tRNA pseudouridine(55) synthase TruB [Candidatus Cloacimonadota bacterium]